MWVDMALEKNDEKYVKKSNLIEKELAKYPRSDTIRLLCYMSGYFQTYLEKFHKQ